MFFTFSSYSSFAVITVLLPLSAPMMIMSLSFLNWLRASLSSFVMFDLGILADFRTPAISALRFCASFDGSFQLAFSHATIKSSCGILSLSEAAESAHY